MSKQELKALLAQGRSQKVIDVLLKRTVNSLLHNEIVQQAGRLKSYQKALRNGTGEEQEIQRNLNQINAALLQIIDELDQDQTGGISWWKYVVGLGVIIGIIAGVVSSLKHLGFMGATGSKSGHSITVLTHGVKGKDDIVLPNRGVVYLIYGDAKIPEQINNEGEATFKQIDHSYFNKGNSVEFLFEDPLGEPYRLRYPDSSYLLTAGQYIALEVQLEGMDQLEGTVKDFVTSEPLDSVLIRIRGHSYYTNTFGEFTIDIPQSQQEQFIDISLSKAGYERKELSKVPTTTKQAQTISLKPL